MAHYHHHSVKNIKVAFFINLAFTFIEVIGGLYTNSLAILSDALHDLGDSLSLGLAWYFENLGQKGRDDTHTYGYKRFTVLGAVINAAVLVAGSVFIVVEAIPRLYQPEPVEVTGMLALAVGGIIFNGFAAYKLHGSNTLNSKMVRLHLLEDVLGWAAVLVGAVVMYFTNAPIIDPILSLLVSAFILFNVVKNVRSAFNVFMQIVPQSINLEEMKRLLQTVAGVNAVHDLHVWSIDGEFHVMSLHIVVSKDQSSDQIVCIKNDVRKILKREKVNHLTIEIEFEGEDCFNEIDL
ncbi:MAG: cation diffusion facilitator family transporter [Cyclobacteriaceae bacterium]